MQGGQDPGHRERPLTKGSTPQMVLCAALSQYTKETHSFNERFLKTRHVPRVWLSTSNTKINNIWSLSSSKVQDTVKQLSFN